MPIRARREATTFKHPFEGVDRLLPVAAYEVITDEEMIERLSFVSFRRVATMIKVPRRHRAFNDGDDFHQLDRSLRRAAH
jgi:hypothetical protein